MGDAAAAAIAAQAAQNQRRAVARAPEIFSLGKNFQTWIKQFRNYSVLANVQPADNFRTFMSFLDPDCFTLVERLELTDAQKQDMYNAATFQLLQQALQKRDSRVEASVLFKYRKQKENESLEDFATEIEKLCQEVYPNEQNLGQNRQLIQTFVSGVYIYIYI